MFIMNIFIHNIILYYICIYICIKINDNLKETINGTKVNNCFNNINKQ